MKKTNIILIVTLALSLLLGALGGYAFGMHSSMNHNNHMMMQERNQKNVGYNQNDAMKEHCEMMPNMAGCEIYGDSMMMDMSDMNPMSMSMADM